MLVSVHDCECVCKSVYWEQGGEEMEQNKLENERVEILLSHLEIQINT